MIEAIPGVRDKNDLSKTIKVPQDQQDKILRVLAGSLYKKYGEKQEKDLTKREDIYSTVTASKDKAGKVIKKEYESSTNIKVEENLRRLIIKEQAEQLVKELGVGNTTQEQGRRNSLTLSHIRLQNKLPRGQFKT